MKELREVTLQTACGIVYVDGFFDDDADSQGINIAEVGLYGRIDWKHPEYRDNPKVQEAITEAEKSLADESLDQFKDNVFRLVSFLENPEREKFKQCVEDITGEVIDDTDDTDELIKMSEKYYYLANHRFIQILKIKEFLENNP